jgi:DASH complex subunit DAD3
MDASATPSVSSGSSQIFSINPYENNPSLSQLEADVLWEYAKLNQHIKDVCVSNLAI